jgi:hypothetical protein
MSLTGHKTEAVYRRYAIVDAAAQEEGVAKLAETVSIENGHRMGIIAGHRADQARRTKLA